MNSARETTSHVSTGSPGYCHLKDVDIGQQQPFVSTPSTSPAMNATTASKIRVALTLLPSSCNDRPCFSMICFFRSRSAISACIAATRHAMHVSASSWWGQSLFKLHLQFRDADELKLLFPPELQHEDRLAVHRRPGRTAPHVRRIAVVQRAVADLRRQSRRIDDLGCHFMVAGTLRIEFHATKFLDAIHRPPRE